jgi:hypothetical protein
MKFIDAFLQTEKALYKYTSLKFDCFQELDAKYIQMRFSSITVALKRL